VLVDAGSGMLSAVTTQVTAVAHAAAAGLTIMCLVYSLGDVSGAHFNPAVTLAFALRGVFPWGRSVWYVLAQLLGGIVAAVLLRAGLGDFGHVGATLPEAGIWTALVAETLMTAFLVTTIICVSNRHQILGPQGAIAAGGAVAICGLAFRPLSGSSMNPARSLGPALMSGSLSTYWIYVVGPLLGACLAVALALLIHPVTKAGEARAARGTD
jgi:MIP family channel proteins